MSKTIATHDGKFHADDVFAVATLLLIEKDATVIRTRDRETIASADYAVDVGEEYAPERNRFDHHQQEGAGMRANTIPYAGFGLIWKHFGQGLVGSTEIAESIDQRLVAPLDAHDNGISLSSANASGVYPYELSDAIRAFVPSWREGEALIDERFFEAVVLAQKILLGEIERAQAAAEAITEVMMAARVAKERRLVVLERDLPWKETLARLPDPLFVVHPQGVSWYVECVRDNPNEFKNRKDLPLAWAGLRDSELAQATGVPDAVFCHRNRFMAVTRSREGALALAELALRA